MPPRVSNASRTWRNCAYFRDKMIAQRLSLNPFKLLHYDINTGELKTFWWYVQPANNLLETFPLTHLNSPAYCNTSIDICSWEDYQQLHDFRYPCCLCPAEAPEDSIKYTECHILRASKSSRQDTGKWIAVCAERACGYFGA